MFYCLKVLFNRNRTALHLLLINLILELSKESQAEQLVKFILICGGASNTKGFIPRLHSEMCERLPQSIMDKVGFRHIKSDAGWHGAFPSGFFKKIKITMKMFVQSSNFEYISLFLIDNLGNLWQIQHTRGICFYPPISMTNMGRGLLTRFFDDFVTVKKQTHIGDVSCVQLIIFEFMTITFGLIFVIHVESRAMSCNT